jgi:DNA-binding XRE family transcriptional regulator
MSPAMETHKNEGALRAEPEPRDGGPNGVPAPGVEPESSAPVARSAADGTKTRREPAERRERPEQGTVANNTRRLRMERMMSKAELARRAGVSTLTIDRVERGMKCRMDTKRKIIEALGLKPEDRAMVFAEDE